MQLLPLLLPLLGACVEHDVYLDKGADGRDLDTAADTDDSGPDDTGPDDTWPDTSELTCPPLASGEAGAYAIDPTCLAPVASPVADPWAVRELWSVTSSADGVYSNVLGTPVAGPLFDDDGDGDVDGDDRTLVVVAMGGITPATAALVILDGATGEEVASIPGWTPIEQIGLGDVDADGTPEILGQDENYRVTAMRPDGNVLWRGPSLEVYLSPATAIDLEGDGVPEVLTGNRVLEGATGRTKLSLPVGSSGMSTHAAPVDADGDGDLELAWDGALYDTDGSVIWDSGARGTLQSWPAVVQADEDPAPEYAFVADEYTLVDDDGTVLAALPLEPTGLSGPPCVADIDGDGAQEIAFAGALDIGGPPVLAVRALDGTPRWEREVVDFGAASCTLFDLDADGGMELLYADEDVAYVIDAITGALRWWDPTHVSLTNTEYPAVVDLDADGHAEIVFSSGDYRDLDSRAVTAIEHDGEGWAPAGDVWATHDFTQSNQAPDLSVPTHPGPFWLSHGVYRARRHADTPDRPDLGVSITDACIADCTYGPVEVAVWVWNGGGADAPAGGAVEIWSDSGGIRTLVASQPLPAVPAGAALDGIVFSLSPEDVGADGFVARVTPAWVGWECDTSDDEAYWAGGCP